jgi:serine/threonine protein kinase
LSDFETCNNTGVIDVKLVFEKDYKSIEFINGLQTKEGDMFSFGAILLEMVIGKDSFSFSDVSKFETLNTLTISQIPIEEFDSDLFEIISKCLKT